MDVFLLLGIKNLDVDHATSHLGKSIGLTNFIRSIPFNAQKARVLIPQELLLKHKLSQENFIRYNKTEAIHDAVFDIAAQAHMHYNKVIVVFKPYARNLITCIHKYFCNGFPLFVRQNRYSRKYPNPHFLLC